MAECNQNPTEPDDQHHCRPYPGTVEKDKGVTRETLEDIKAVMLELAAIGTVSRKRIS